MAKVLHCGLEVSEFDLQAWYYVHFQTNILRKGMKLLILPTIDKIVSLLFFYKDGFGFKQSTKVYMPLKTEIKKEVLIKYIINKGL